jgi:hypothetical protein
VRGSLVLSSAIAMGFHSTTSFRFFMKYYPLRYWNESNLLPYCLLKFTKLDLLTVAEVIDCFVLGALGSN